MDPLARARIEELMGWQATEFNFAWRVAFQAIVRKNADAGSVEQIRQSLAEWTPTLRLLERRLVDAGAFVCGDTFTVADVVIGLSVNRWFQTPMARAELPAVRDYFDRLLQRKAARAHFGGDTD